MSKLVCFDFDDVIVNNRIYLKIPLLRKKFKAFELGKDFIKGSLDPKQFNTFANHLMQQVEGMSAEFIIRLLLRMRLRKGTKEVFRQLHKNGYKIVIVSVNDEVFIKRFLEKHKLTEYVAHIYAAKFGVKDGKLTGTIDGEVIKTEKTGVLPIIERKYNIKRFDVIYVGDGLTDLPMMKKIGKGILFNPNPLTKVEVFTDKILKGKEEKGELFLVEAKDLRDIMEFI
jgi:HAD superfamily phosphoserine phosphatase-like hydrolase